MNLNTENLYLFNTFFLDKEGKKYTRWIKVRKLVLSQKVTYQFLLLTLDFGEEQEDIPYWQKLMCYLFDEIILEITYSDTAYSQVKTQRIRNHDALKKAWNRLKATLSVDHKGIAIWNYFQQMDRLIENQDLLLDFVYRTSVYGVFLGAVENKNSFFGEDGSLEETFLEEEGLKYEVLIKKHR